MSRLTLRPRGSHLAHTATALLVVLASQAGDGGCAPADPPRSQVCEVNTRGIEVDDDGSHVRDVVTARCEVSPKEHTIEAWLQYSTSRWGGWANPRGPARSSVIPDAEGVSLRVSLACKQGYYRAAWRTHGRGPALPDHPNGIGFDQLDGDAGATFIDADECAG